jgi:hypothetical protein
MSDDLNLDLDSLLKDATKEAAIRKAARGAKSSTDPEIQEAIAELTWSHEALIALFVESHCECGSSTRFFLGWYRLDLHRREAGCHRWVLLDGPDLELEACSHTIQRQTIWCKHCVGQYPEAGLYGYPIESLGTPCTCGDAGEQLELWEN